MSPPGHGRLPVLVHRSCSTPPDAAARPSDSATAIATPLHTESRDHCAYVMQHSVSPAIARHRETACIRVVAATGRRWVGGEGVLKASWGLSTNLAFVPGVLMWRGASAPRSGLTGD